MNHAEIVLLLRIVRSGAPSQHLDDGTPDVWHGILGDLDFHDCHNAVNAVLAAQTYVSASEIRERVVATLNERHTARMRERHRASEGPLAHQSPQTATEGIRTVREHLATAKGQDPLQARRHAAARTRARTVTCPWCRATPGSPCVTPATGEPLILDPQVHPSRIDAGHRAVIDDERLLTAESG